MAQLLLDAEYSGWTWETTGARHDAIPARRSFQITVPRRPDINQDNSGPPPLRGRAASVAIPEATEL